MRDVIAHRGPDDAGIFVDAQAALGHRRLSIVDLAAGHQPLSNEDGTVWIVFNGEIYNHADVRARARGRRPSLPDAVRHRNHRPRLRAVGRRLRRPPARHVRVRDLGRATPAPAARARSARREAALLGACRRPAAVRIRDQVDPGERADPGARRTRARCRNCSGTRYLSGAETLFKGIHRLQPGHTLVFENGAVSVREYWDVPVGTRVDEMRRRSRTATSWRASASCSKRRSASA